MWEFCWQTGPIYRITCLSQMGNTGQDLQVFLFNLRLCQQGVLPNFSHHILNLEAACLGTHVVHGNEVICFPANVCPCKFPSAEAGKLIFESIFEVSYVLVNSV